MNKKNELESDKVLSITKEEQEKERLIEENMRQCLRYAQIPHELTTLKNWFVWYDRQQMEQLRKQRLNKPWTATDPITKIVYNSVTELYEAAEANADSINTLEKELREITASIVRGNIQY